MDNKTLRLKELKEKLKDYELLLEYATPGAFLGRMFILSKIDKCKKELKELEA